MIHYRVTAQSYTTSQRVQRVVIASDETEALVTANWSLNGDFYVVSVVRVSL